MLNITRSWIDIWCASQILPNNPLKTLIYFSFFPAGLEVMVKFRDKYDLQRLDPFKQSGGERSVSTALYMMAMQHMTQVPFRCVDEINQVSKLPIKSFQMLYKVDHKLTR